MQDQQSQQIYNMDSITQQDQLNNLNLLKLPTYQNQNNFNLLNNLMSNPNNQNLLMNQQQQDVYKQQFQIQQPYLLQNQKMQAPKEPSGFINNYNKQLLPNPNNSVQIPQTLGSTQQQQYIYQNSYIHDENQGQFNYVDTMQQQQYPIPYTPPMPIFQQGVPLQYVDPYFQYNQPQYQQQYQQQQYGIGVQGLPKIRYYDQEEGLDNIIFPSEKKLKKNYDPRRVRSRDNRRRRSRSRSRSRSKSKSKSKSKSREVKRGGHKKTLNITLSEGDWECGECKNWNFKRREKCNQCGQEKSSSDKVYSESKGDSKRGHDRERISVTKRISHNQKGYKPKEGDWECKQCKNINYARREECNRCSNKRPN